MTGFVLVFCSCCIALEVEHMRPSGRCLCVKLDDCVVISPCRFTRLTWITASCLLRQLILPNSGIHLLAEIGGRVSIDIIIKPVCTEGEREREGEGEEREREKQLSRDI